MKKLLLIILLTTTAFCIQPAKAQFEYAGGGIALATGGKYTYDGLPYYNKSFGIDLRAVYDYSKKIQFVPDLKFYLPNKEEFASGGESKTTVLVFNLNAHYILNSHSRGNYRLYLLGGAHVGAWHIKDNRFPSFGSLQQLDVNAFKIVPGANVGAGMQFPIGASAIFFSEVKFVVSKASQMVFTPGILFVL